MQCPARVNRLEWVLIAFSRCLHFGPQVDRGLEWLHSDQSSRRLAACFVLKELAENAPTLFFVKTSEFFDRIWIVLRDPKPIIRINAAR